MPEKNNYQIRVGNRKIIAWSNIDKNGNPYLSYSIVKSEKDQYNQWTDKTINCFADDLAVFQAMIERMLATVALKPTAFATKDNSASGGSEPREQIEVGQIGDGIPF